MLFTELPESHIIIKVSKRHLINNFMRIMGKLIGCTRASIDEKNLFSTEHSEFYVYFTVILFLNYVILNKKNRNSYLTHSVGVDNAHFDCHIVFISFFELNRILPHALLSRLESVAIHPSSQKR